MRVASVSIGSVSYARDVDHPETVAQGLLFEVTEPGIWDLF